jgi:hypothetical protein
MKIYLPHIRAGFRRKEWLRHIAIEADSGPCATWTAEGESVDVEGSVCAAPECASCNDIPLDHGLAFGKASRADGSGPISEWTRQRTDLAMQPLRPITWYSNPEPRLPSLSATIFRC